MVRTLVILLVMTSHARADDPAAWRSSLYPGDWAPGYTDSAGRFLPDFSHAGYRRGEQPPPGIAGPVIDVAAAPFATDASGHRDATDAIQRAIDADGAADTGVVFLPAGAHHPRAARRILGR